MPNQTTHYTSLTDLPDFCTVSDLAQVLGVSKATAYRLTASGVIPCLRLGRRVIISRTQMIQWLTKMLEA